MYAGGRDMLKMMCWESVVTLLGFGSLVLGVSGMIYEDNINGNKGCKGRKGLMLIRPLQSRLTMKWQVAHSFRIFFFDGPLSM